MERDKQQQLEEQLELIAKKTESYEIPQAPPLFELYTALVALTLAVLMFLVPEVLVGETSLTTRMEALMPIHGWGIGFMLAGIVGAVGILTNSKSLRYLGLALKTILFGAITVFYYQTIPNFGFVIMSWFTIFCLVAMPFIKYSGLSYKRKRHQEDEEIIENRRQQ